MPGSISSILARPTGLRRVARHLHFRNPVRPDHHRCQQAFSLMEPNRLRTFPSIRKGIGHRHVLDHGQVLAHTSAGQRLCTILGYRYRSGLARGSYTPEEYGHGDSSSGHCETLWQTASSRRSAHAHSGAGAATDGPRCGATSGRRSCSACHRIVAPCRPSVLKNPLHHVSFYFRLSFRLYRTRRVSSRRTSMDITAAL